MRFKKGDRLVVTGFPVKDSLSESAGWNIGDEFTVMEVHNQFYSPERGASSTMVLFDQEVELADVYNSPLYKALR